MTDCELIKFLSNGYTVKEISIEKKINKRTIEKRIFVLRERFLCKTVTQLAVTYYRKNLIS